MDRNTLQYIFMALALVLLLLVSGCEDDPILEEPPQESPGGSYGKMSFPDSNARKKDDILELKENPETF